MRFIAFIILSVYVVASVEVKQSGATSSVHGHSRSSRSLRLDRTWTRSGYGIVFVYSSFFGPYEVQQLTSAVDEIRKFSCFPLRIFSQSQFFRSESGKFPNYVFIEKNNAVGCGQAVVGMRGGQQRMTLSPDPGCFTIGTIMHEMLHSLGLEHEQSRPDRNQYIYINNPNVQTGLENVFDIAYGTTPYGPYDFDSVMHYGRFAFAAFANHPTLSSRINGRTVPVSMNSQLSFWDKRKINVITGCKVNS